MNFARPQSRLVCGALFAGTFLLYCGVLTHGFIVFDDIAYVVTNWHVNEGFSFHNIIWAFKTGFAANWHPLTWLSHMLDGQLFGLDHPAGHHLINLLLHCANASLLFEVLRRMTGARWRSAMVAALFAWHPLHVESVAWIAERKDVLSTFFGLITLLFYERYVTAIKLHKPGRTRFYKLAFFAFALALMAKPMLVTLPFVLLLLDYWPLARTKNEVSGRHDWKKLIAEKTPFFLLTIICCLVTFAVQKNGGAVNGLAKLPFGTRLINSLLRYEDYLFKTFVPLRLAIFYPLPNHLAAWRLVSAAILLALVTGISVSQRQRRPYLLLGWLWFLGTLVPVIGLVQVGSQAMADRYSYLTITGLFIAVVWWFAEISTEWKNRTMILSTASAVVLVSCAVLTVRQIGYWKNDLTLFQHAYDVTRPNEFSEANLGLAFLTSGNTNEAIRHYQASLKLAPNSPDTLRLMAVVYAGESNYPAAIEYYEKSLSHWAKSADVHYNLANAYMAVKKFDAAIAAYSQAVTLEPDLAETHNNLGAALLQIGKPDEALAQFQEALRLKPNYSEAQMQLGNIYLKQRELDRALSFFMAALQSKPDFATAQFKVGFIFAQQGKMDEAIDHFHKALKIEPQNANVWYNLGATEQAMGHNQAAAAAYQEVLKIQPEDKDARARLDALTKRMN